MPRTKNSKNYTRYKVIKVDPNISETRLADLLYEYSKERYELDSTLFIPNVGLKLIFAKRWA